jgi:thiol:disulfide interchange protein
MTPYSDAGGGRAALARIAGGLLLWALLCSSGHGAEPPYSRAYDPARDPFEDGRAALDLAVRTGRNVLIEIGGDWCSWCHALDRTIKREPGLRLLLERHYVVLKVNVSEDNENAAFLQGLPAFTGYPHIFIANAQGTVMHSQEVSKWLLQGRYDPGRIAAFLLRWRPAAPAGREAVADTGPAPQGQ